MSNPKKPGTGATNRRRRELAAAKRERQEARRVARHAQHRRRLLIGWSVAVLVGVLAVAALVFWPSTSGDDVAAPAPTAAGCGPAPTPPADPQSWDAAPELTLEDGTDYQLTLATNCGDIVIDTAAAEAPETVNSMLWLAEQGYFDSTLCHRVTTQNPYVLQCGDPTASGTGGPGFTVPDENLPEAGDANYPAGTVAMANAGPGTAGSQFFLVYQDTTLPADYTIWGQVTEGRDIVEKVAAAGAQGDKGDGAPLAPIGIEKATVSTSEG
ncbi:MAG: peptidylprolyl isomerase [Candidatus Nanopelagicales bacterium]